MTLSQLIVPILMAATTPVADPPAPAAPVADTPRPAKLEFPLAGYRINALASATKTSSIFTMSLPVSGNSQSSPSVKVNRQLTMKERPSKQNIADAKTIRAHNGDTILVERTLSPAEWRMEYTSTKDESGTFETGMKTHIYRRMVTANGLTYDVSATVPETQWSALEAKLKACVDSFELSTDPAPGEVVFPQQGYRINILDGAAPADAKQTLIAMPGGVLVGIQPYTKSIEEYKAHHEPDIFRKVVNAKKENGVWIEATSTSPGPMKILTENAPAQNALVTEYAEEIPVFPKQPPPSSIVAPPRSNLPQVIYNKPENGQVLIYEKVILVHGQLYWAAGIHDGETDVVSYAEIKACVDSLETPPIPAPAQAPNSTPAK